MARAQKDRSTEVQRYGYRIPYVDAATVAGIQTVFNRTRLSHQTWEGRQLQGRLDSRTVWRNSARGSIDIFRERRQPSPTKLDVHLLVDASGSMSGDRACRAQDMAATMVDAFKRIPTVRVHVWQHNATSGTANIYRIFEPGMATHGFNSMLNNIDGGNADGFALQAIGERVVRMQRADTLSLIIVISDGLPSVNGLGATGNILDHSVMVTQNLARKNVSVMGVAIAGDMRAHEQMYGEGSSILFTGDWNDLNRKFGAIFGKVLAKAKTR